MDKGRQLMGQESACNDIIPFTRQFYKSHR